MREISVANKRREELFDLSVKALKLAIEIMDEQGDQLGISTKLATEDETIPYTYSLKSDSVFFYLFTGSKHFLSLRVSFCYFRRLSGSVQLFGGFR